MFAAQPQALTIIDRVKSGNWQGLNCAPLVRLSFEADVKKYKSKPRFGSEINNREVQLERILRLVEARGGHLLSSYDEEDTSAFKQQAIDLPDGTKGLRVIRPIFQGALRDLKRGIHKDGERLDMIVVIDSDRLTRDPRELQDAIEAVKLSARPIIDIHGILDLTTELGQQAAGYMNMGHNAYSASVSRKVTDSHYQRSQLGIPCGGNRPFGWKDDKRTLEPHEQALLMDAVRDVLHGIHIKTIIRRWNKAGVTTSLGNKWDSRSLRGILLSPRICGWRPYQVAGKKRWEAYAIDYKTGKPVIGQWERIIEPDEWHKVVAQLTNVKHQENPGNGKIQYLMTRFLMCSGCGAGLTGGWDNREKRAVYACKDPDCQTRVSGAVKAINCLVEEYLFELLAGAELTTVAQPWGREHELQEAEAKVAELLAAYDADDMPADFVFPRVKAKRAEIAVLKKERTAHLNAQPTTPTTDIATRWPAMELEQKREVLETVGLTAVLKRSPAPCNRFKPERLEIIVS